MYTGQEKLYKGDPIALTIDYGNDLTLATLIQILLIYPDGSSVYLSATAADSTHIYHMLTPTENKAAGALKIQGYAEFGGPGVHGGTVTLYINDLGA